MWLPSEHRKWISQIVPPTSLIIEGNNFKPFQSEKDFTPLGGFSYVFFLRAPIGLLLGYRRFSRCPQIYKAISKNGISIDCIKSAAEERSDAHAPAGHVAAHLQQLEDAFRDVRR